VPDAPITLSTASVYPEKVPAAFEMAAQLGYDGIEVMVATDPASQDLTVLRRLSDYHQIPIRSIHAPCLLLTQRVWGREPWGKLQRSKEVAEALGADVVVVHPPFRWQREYARDFAIGIARMQDETDVVFAVENMFPVRARGSEVGMYAPHWNPVDQDYPNVTLDLSHTALSGSTWPANSATGSATCTWPTASASPTATSIWSPAEAGSRASRCWKNWPPVATAGTWSWRSTPAAPPPAPSGSTTSPRRSPSLGSTSQPRAAPGRSRPAARCPCGVGCPDGRVVAVQASAWAPAGADRDP
jgi:hypothetical protein